MLRGVAGAKPETEAVRVLKTIAEKNFIVKMC
jgi:hypothetical protein